MKKSGSTQKKKKQNHQRPGPGLNLKTQGGRMGKVNTTILRKRKGKKVEKKNSSPSLCL